MNVRAESRLSSLHGELEDRLAEAMGRLAVPGAAVGIYHQGEEDHVHRGITSIDNPLEVNSNTLFQIGSTTKTYTATAAMVLVDLGKLDLDAPVRKYVPELRLKDEDVAAKVTVLQLLNHTGGWLGDVFTDTGDGDDYLERYVELLADVDQLNPLGKFASYNNAAFVVAGLVIQRVAGKRYEDVIKDLVLAPLGMKNSYLFPKEVMARRFVAGHGEREGVLKVSTPWALPRSANPPGGIISNTADQVVYARFHLGGGVAPDGTRLLREDTVRRMQEPTSELRGGALGDHVGICWLLRDVAGTRVVAHGGSTNGQQSSFDLVPSRDFAITILTNADRGAALHKELTAWALDAYLDLKAPKEKPLSLGPEELAVYTGEYSNRNAVIKVTADGQRLVLKVRYTKEGIEMVKAALGENPPDPEPIIVHPLAGNRYVVAEGDAKGMNGTFILDGAGRVTDIEVGGRLAHKISE
ncbi:MAG: serine hydrolase domain-containing protein [Candidatus Dormibacteria bacterium]